MAIIRWDKALGTWSKAQEIRYDPRNKHLFTGISSGIDAMDAVDRIQFPFYGVIVAKNKAGKTAMMLTLSLAFAKAKCVVLFVSMEMTIYQMCSRMAANASYTDMNQYEHLKATADDWMRTSDAIDRLSALGGYFSVDTNTLPDLRRDIDTVKKENPGKRIVVVLDYANLMRDPEQPNEYVFKTNLSKWFKAQTRPKDYDGSNLTPENMLGLNGDGISILTAVQVTVGAKRSGQKLTDASAVETGAWGNDADYMWTINSVTNDAGEEIPDRKHITMGGRFTAGGEFDVAFNRGQARYEDPQDAQEVDPVL